MRAILMAATAIVVLGAAAAKPARVADPVLGAWQFETAIYSGSCKMSGAMQIRPGPKPNTYACTFVATETCEGLKVRAEQTCTAVKDGKTFTISSTIVKLTPEVSYAPDDWALTIVDSGRMTGELRSADIAPVTFYRGLGAIS